MSVYKVRAATDDTNSINRLPARADVQFPLTSPADSQASLGDLRFRKLLGASAWAELPPAVRRRFSKRLAGGNTAIYVGVITEMRLTWAGYILTQLARMIGAPLPLSRDIMVPTVVTVTEDIASGGQIWTRLYAHRSGFPQVIHSSKRFAGPTGLEEHIGCGIGMCLKISASSNALTFKSSGYFVKVGRLRINLPNGLSPGDLTVNHEEITPERFAFTLDLDHPLFGRIIHQRAEFREAEPVAATAQGNCLQSESIL